MPRQKKSPVPHLITDAELARYPKLSLRLKTLKNGDQSIEVIYRDPFTDRTRSRSVPATRDAVLDALHVLASIVSTKRPERLRDPQTPFHVVAQEW
ncbi:MAG: hypothetical protein ACYC62_01455, partial [Coriobacteriia bacterium]